MSAEYTPNLAAKKCMGHSVLLILLFATLTGCYPAYRTIQPETEIHVLDRDGHSIEGAEVHLYSIGNPHSILENNVASWSNQDGVVRFGRIKDWKLAAPFLMHGLLIMHWNICVTSEGNGSAQLLHLNKQQATGKVEVVLDGNTDDAEKEGCENFLPR